MLKNKKSYFQGGGGVNEPTPHKKKYKSDDQILTQSRFEEPLYFNYDLYETKENIGPGTGAYRIDKHKSIKDFLNKSRKRIKEKYKSNDSFIDNEGRKKRIKARKNLLNKFLKIGIDFKIDDQINSGPISENNDSSYSNAIPIGGILNPDEILPENDSHLKSPDKLNFSRDIDQNNNLEKFLKEILNKYPKLQQSSFLGLPDGIESDEDLDAYNTENNMNPEYGITDSGNTFYDKI